MKPIDPAGSWGPSTRCVWGGEPEDSPEGATVQPVFHGVTFAYDELEAWRAAGTGEGPGYIYSRNRNPTVELLEEKVRALEDGEAATSFATGMAAVSNALFTLLSPGDRVVSIRDTYGGTGKIFTEFLPRFGVEVTLCATDDPDALEEEVARGCRVLYLESPTNPTLKVLDLARLAGAARAAGALTVVDNTFATPVNQRPLELGADLVVYSATKFLGGHSDAMGGLVVGPRELVERIFHFREINGASLDPMSAFLLARGLRTLEVRVERHNANAQAVAEFLSAHPAVEAVFYPGLAAHPGHDVARRQMRGYGGVLSFTLAGGPEVLDPFLGGLRLAHRAASLGSVATLVGPPATTSHVELSRRERAEAGIPETLVRYSVGIENAADLIADLRTGLDRVTPAHGRGGG
jgi:cystathionine gamma-synthase